MQPVPLFRNQPVNSGNVDEHARVFPHLAHTFSEVRFIFHGVRTAHVFT
jgi:hypothetical protein